MQISWRRPMLRSSFLRTEDSALKDDAEGAYQEIMNNMSYDDEDSKDLAQEMIDAVDEVEASKA